MICKKYPVLIVALGFYGINLPISPETGAGASAEIVTEELRLIERFFLPIKRVVKEGFSTKREGYE